MGKFIIMNNIILSNKTICKLAENQLQAIKLGNNFNEFMNQFSCLNMLDLESDKIQGLTYKLINDIKNKYENATWTDVFLVAKSKNNKSRLYQLNIYGGIEILEIKWIYYSNIQGSKL